jgi:DNA polymerase-3 subunit epsilon
MHHRPLVFLDIETTGLSPQQGRVLEIGALRVENNKVVKTFNQLLQPEEKVSWFTTKLTGITDEMVWDAPLFKGIAADLELFMSDAIFVAHNVSFDYGFIKEEFARIGNKWSMDRLCTVRLSRALYPEQRKHSLDSVIAAHNLTVANRHRALDDAKVMVDFFDVCLKQHGLGVYAAMDKLITSSR